MAKQAVKKTAEALVFRFVRMGRGVLGLLNRFGGSLSGGCGGVCGFKTVLEIAIHCHLAVHWRLALLGLYAGIYVLRVRKSPEAI